MDWPPEQGGQARRGGQDRRAEHVRADAAGLPGTAAGQVGAQPAGLRRTTFVHVAFLTPQGVGRVNYGGSGASPEVSGVLPEVSGALPDEI